VRTLDDPIDVVLGALHHDELKIDLPLVRALVDRLRPEFAALPLRRLELSGSSNALFRLGDDLLVRFPRQPGGSAAIDKEAIWLPVIAPRLPVGVPEIVAVGEPGFGYPERWSLVRWLDGSVPSVPDPGVPVEPPRTELARDLAKVVAAIGEIDVPADAQADPALRWYRGDPLVTRDSPTRQAIAACRAIDGLTLDLDEVSRVWRDAIRLPDAHLASTPRWYHGDLFAENLLVRDGRLTAILDFGGLGIGDPTIDLIVAWEVLAAWRLFAPGVAKRLHSGRANEDGLFPKRVLHLLAGLLEVPSHLVALTFSFQSRVIQRPTRGFFGMALRALQFVLGLVSRTHETPPGFAFRNHPPPNRQL
jgi:aminoglycoside phosphotransferase (APT) family kinase protein